MKALTICQPYAHLICAKREKRVENRTWATRFRGPLLIHAGMSRKWLDAGRATDGTPIDAYYNILLSDMPFGAIVGAAVVIDCVHIDTIRAGRHDKRFPWLRDHDHSSGPWCWLLGNRHAFAKHVPFTGALGLFDVPDSVVAEQLALLADQGIRYGVRVVGEGAS
jgi:hypothetical protein